MIKRVIDFFPEYNDGIKAVEIGKIVFAGDIADCECDGSAIAFPANKKFKPFKLERNYLKEFRPVKGGYFILKKDHTLSYLPGKIFKKKYKLINQL